MKPARATAAVATAVVTAALGWVLLDLWQRQGGTLPPPAWAAAVVILVVAAVVLALGREVRRSVRGERERLNPLAAARVAVLAKAAVYGGAVLAGWYTAQAVVVLDDASGTRRDRVLTSGGTALACALLVAAGLVAQRWCRLPPDDDEPGPPEFGGAERDGVPPSPRARGERE